MAHGLLSHHIKPFTKDSLTQDLNGLLETIESFDQSASLTAAKYLRSNIFDKQWFDQLLIIERKILDIYLGRVDQMFNVVKPMAELGFKSDEIAILRQLKLIDPSQEEEIQDFLEEHIEEASLEDG